MKVKELIDELQKIENKELEIYVEIHDEVIWAWWEDLNDGIPDKYIEKVELWYQVNWNWPNEPCVILK